MKQINIPPTAEDITYMEEKHPSVKWYKCPKAQGKCLTPMACMFCHFGHMLDCHYPKTCSEAECSHWKVQVAMEGELESNFEDN